MVHLAEQSNVDVIQIVGMMKLYKKKAKAWLKMKEGMCKLELYYNKCSNSQRWKLYVMEWGI